MTKQEHGHAKGHQGAPTDRAAECIRAMISERIKGPLWSYKAKTIIVDKRSMAAGCAGFDKERFYIDKTMMVFGDAKKVAKAVE